MRSGVRQRGAIAAACVVLTTLSACFNPALSPGERMARACGYYADALEADSVEDRLFHLGDAQHWAELAKEKDESYEAVETAFGHLIADIDPDDDVSPDDEVVAAARTTVGESCEEHAEVEVQRRIDAAQRGVSGARWRLLPSAAGVSLS